MGADRDPGGSTDDALVVVAQSQRRVRGSNRADNRTRVRTPRNLRPLLWRTLTWRGHQPRRRHGAVMPRAEFVPRTPDFVNVRGAARELGIAPRTILARIRHGQIQA